MLSLNIATITEARIERLTGGLDPQKKAVKLARTRTMRRVIKYADLQVKRSLSAQTGLPQKALKGRVITKAKHGGSEGVVWIGAFGVSPYKIANKVIQNKVGVRAGRVSFAGAFKPGRVGNTSKRVFIRAASKKFDPARYKGRAFGTGKGFPLVAVAENIQDAAEKAINLNTDDIEERFDTIFLQELNFALNVEK